jgi:hypothetical protein
MKTFFFLMLFAAAFFLGWHKHDSHHTQTAPAGQKADSIREVHVQIVGIKQADQKKFTQAILKTPGILQIRFEKVDESRIRFDLAKITLKDLGDAIQRAGYTPYFH